MEATREGSSGRDRILIVEDNVVAVMVLRKKFCESGFADDAIDTVTSGEEAVDQVRTLVTVLVSCPFFFLSACTN